MEVANTKKVSSQVDTIPVFIKDVIDVDKRDMKKERCAQARKGTESEKKRKLRGFIVILKRPVSPSKYRCELISSENFDCACVIHF